MQIWLSTFEQLFFFQLLVLFLLHVCFLFFKLFGHLVATTLPSSNPTLPNEGDILDWNLKYERFKAWHLNTVTVSRQRMHHTHKKTWLFSWTSWMVIAGYYLWNNQECSHWNHFLCCDSGAESQLRKAGRILKISRCNF